MPSRPDLYKSLHRWLSDLMWLDPRSLACLRIGIAAVLLYDVHMAWEVIDVWPALQDYYDGLPLPIVPALGEIGTLKLVFAAYALLALGLLLGWHTRFCTFGVWIALAGHHYAAQIIDYHDDVLFHVLFWVQFLDLGRAFSLDARARRRGCGPDLLQRLGALGLVFNLAFIYVSTVVEKDSESWWNEGTAVFFALKDLAYSGPVGLWAVENLPFFLFQIACYLVLAIEFFAGLSLLLPQMRLVGSALLVVFHLGLWMAMGLESFPATMLAALAALLPSRIWQRLGVALPLPGWRHRPTWQRRVRLALLASVLFVNLEGRRLMRLEDEDWPYVGALEMAELRYFWGLNARWQMYGPGPPSYSGWWVCVAYTASGEELDPITGRPPTFAPPDRSSLPFRGLGSIYWFAAPEKGGDPHEDIARYLLWVDERYQKPQGRLTHFSLFYVYEPFRPVQQSPHVRKPLLVMRWPAERIAPRPALRDDSVLRDVQVYGIDEEKLDDMGERHWSPPPLPPLQTY